MKIYTLITAVITLFCFTLSAQDVEFKSGNFKDDKEGFKEAKDALDKGDEYYELGNEAVFAVKSPGISFKQALVEYEKAQDFNPNNALLNYKIGVCHAYSENSYKCIPFLYKAHELNAACDPLMKYYYGLALQLDEKFSDAVRAYNTFKDEYKKAEDYGKFVMQRINECKRAQGAKATPERVWVDNVTELNTAYNDYAPAVTTDGSEIIYTSNRPNGHTADAVGEYDDDLYSATKVGGKWTDIKPLKGGVNTGEDEVANNLSYDGTRMLLHRVDDGQTDIYESVLTGLNWSSPTKLPRQISTANNNEVFASYSDDGWSIYFNRVTESGTRGFEVMKSSMQSKITKDYKSASKVTKVNSKFNEGPIYVTIDGEFMYIASQGGDGYGGYDIFVSKKANGSWSEPVNLGYPINTPYDDFYFSASANGKFAYICSNRAGGQGGYDIYKVTYWGPQKNPAMETEDYLLASIVNPIKDNALEATVEVKQKSFTVFKGKTIDAITKKPVQADIEIIDNSNGQVIETFTTNSATGKFLITLASGKNYGIAVKAEGYLFHSENFDIPQGSADNLVNKVIELKNIAVGSKIALRNIFFDTGKSVLRSESNAELDRLVKLLEDVPSLEIEISGHTDNTGSASLNEKLSQSRADAVVTYLKSKGISASRLTSEGYGSRQPIATNNTSDGRQQNRRTEFEIKKN
ncbi:MAG: hypothetical protein Crog4KO_32930 [Crocinitomicaceae bacterium]